MCELILFLKAILYAISKIRAQIVHKIHMFFALDFHTFSPFFFEFVRIAPLYLIALLKTWLKTLKGKYTRHFCIQKQLIFTKNHAFFTFSIKLTSKLRSKFLRDAEKKWRKSVIFHLFSTMCQSHLLEWQHKSARITQNFSFADFLGYSHVFYRATQNSQIS